MLQVDSYVKEHTSAKAAFVYVADGELQVIGEWNFGGVMTKAPMT